MAEIEIFYKIYLDEDEKNINIIKEKPLYYMKKDAPNEITKETLKNYLIEDGYNPDYFEVVSKYKIVLKNEKDEEIKENEKGAFILGEKGNYKLNLDLIIDRAKEEARIKKEEEKEKEIEKNEYELQFSNMNQISSELNDIKRQINYLQKDIKNEQNEVISWIKKNLYINKKFLSKFEEKKNITMIQSKKNPKPIIKSNLFMTNISNEKFYYVNKPSGEIQDYENNVDSKKYCKIIYLFSRFKKRDNIIQENNQSEKENLLEEDTSFWQQFLKIHDIIKNKEDIYVDLKLKQIKESLFLEENPNILHLRIDSIIKDDSIKFHWENSKLEYFEYSLDNLMANLTTTLKKIENLKLLIISSQNIEKIKESLDTLNNLKRINIIYINHSKLTENEENNFIENIYNYMINKEQTIKNAFNKSINNDNKKLFIKNIKNDEVCFDKKNNIPESGNESKNLLNYEMMRNIYCLIGRKDELNLCLKKFKVESQKRLCVFGTKGVGKKSFAKKVGFSSIEKNIFDKAYYLEINSIDNSNFEMKVNMLIDEIYELCTKETKILLIIYFNEQINRIYDLKEFIYYCENIKKENLIISYLYTFTLDKANIKECQNEFTNILELTHFKKYQKEEKKITNFKDLFNFCVKEVNIEFKNNLIEKVNKIFDKLSNSPKEKEIYNPLEASNRNVQTQTTILTNKENINNVTTNINKNNKNVMRNSINFGNNIIEKKEEKLKGLKIDNIFLLALYINFCKDKDIETVFDLLINDDDELVKKKIISNIIKPEGNDKNNNDYIYNLFLYLNKLVCGIGKSSLKMLLDDKTEKKINFIKEKLYGLIIVEYYMDEEIFRIDSSFKNLIEQIINNDKNLIITNDIFKNYFICFRKLLNQYDIKKGFHACIENNFWYDNEIKKKLINKNKYDTNDFKLICDIDSNNIYHLIKNVSNDIYDNIETRTYINDISISLPTLLYFTDNFYFEYLIIDIFEKLYENLKKKENTLKINGLILRLGIFKYWVSKNPSFFEKSLKLAGITDKININLNDEAKFEYYLSKIYDCIIKKDRNIEEFSFECGKILEKDKENIYYKLNEQRLNDLINDAIIKIDKDPRHKFFFLLTNPLKNNKFKTILNSNFYLTQKLLTKIPSNFGVEFKTFKDENEIKNLISFFNNSAENNYININFLYISSKALKDKLFDYFKGTNCQNHIKILILGYLGSEENFDEEIKNLPKKISHIIYISKNNTIEFDKDAKNYNNKSYYYYFELYFNKFVHDFVSFITSKYEYSTIKEAFIKAKRNFVTNFERIFESEDQIEKGDLTNEKQSQKDEYKKLITSIENLINYKSVINDDVFEIENFDEEENLNNHQKVINDIYDEYEFEYNKIKNIYYRKNPFTEETESQLKKGKYKKYMKLPGIDNLSPKNFKYFVEKEIYDVNKIVSILEKKILENNLVNIYGKDNVFDLGDELCKYFYMSGNFANGIYIISPRNIEEEKDWLIEAIKLKGNSDELNNIFILLKLLNIKDKDINISEINKLASILINEIHTHIVICSEDEFVDLLNCEKCDLNKLK